MLTLDYQEFKKETFIQLTQESTDLLLNVYVYIGKAYDDIGYPLKKFEAFLKASEYVGSPAREVLLWKALVGYGSHYEKTEFLKVLSLLNGKSIIVDSANRVVLARIFFALGLNNDSWREIMEIWKSQPVVASYFVLLRDFFMAAEGENSLQLQSYQEWLDAKENSGLRKESLLEGLWVRRLWFAANKTLQNQPLPTYEIQDGRGIASENAWTPANPNVSHENQLNERLGRVAQILNRLVENKQKIRRIFGARYPNLLVEAICKQSEETNAAAKVLSEQRYPDINHPKWPHFVAKLNEKIKELEFDYVGEVRSCQNKREESAMLDSVRHLASPLCEFGPCPARIPATEVETLRKQAMRVKKNSLDLIHELVMGGAWLGADYYADEINLPGEKILAIGYIRWAFNDRKTAYLMLKELLKPKTPKELKSHAALLLASLAWMEGANKILQNYLAEIDISVLSSWELSVLEKLKSKK
jgi:hypothetical protein